MDNQESAPPPHCAQPSAPTIPHLHPIRAFVALTPDPKFVPAFASLQSELRALPGGREIQWAKPDQIHLTLRFLGNIGPNEAQLAVAALEHACHAFDPFWLDLAGLGYFPNPQRPRIVWLGLEGDTASLLELQRSVSQAFAAIGSHQEEKAFHPHLTVGRLRFNARHPRLDRARLPSPPRLGRWHVRFVDLLRSELNPAGARHSLLHREPLAPRRH